MKSKHMAPQLQINQGPQDAPLFDKSRSYFTNDGYVRTPNFHFPNYKSYLKRKEINHHMSGNQCMYGPTMVLAGRAGEGGLCVVRCHWAVCETPPDDYRR